MKRVLFLVRHAKSSWTHGDLADKKRPLNKRGIRDAPAMGERLVRRGHKPEVIVSSSAVRAIETARAIARELEYPLEAIVVDDRIYLAGAQGLLQVIREFSDDRMRVMVVGHNPDMTDLVNRLAGEDIDNVPTCGIATLGFDIARWAGLGDGAGVLLDYDYPKKGDA